MKDKFNKKINKNKTDRKKNLQIVIIINENIKKKYKIKCEYKKNIFQKSCGFMFRFQKNIIMIFPFKKNTHIDIHNFFVFQTLMCFWLDEKNIVIEKKELKPFTIYNTKNKSKVLLEIPKKLYINNNMNINIKDYIVIK